MKQESRKGFRRIRQIVVLHKNSDQHASKPNRKAQQCPD